MVKEKVLNIWNIAKEVLLAIIVVTLPITLQFGAWVVGETYKNKSFRESGGRFSKEDGLVMEIKTKEYTDFQVRQLRSDNNTKLDKIILYLEAMEHRIDALPPVEWKDRIKKLEDNMDEIRQNQSRIMVLLEKM